MRLIDLSLTVEPSISEPVPVEVQYVSHQQGADILGTAAGIDHSHFPDHMGLSLEHVRLTTHTGTHVDAPVHYGPLCEGKPAKTVEELPLEWFFADGVLLDCRGDSQTPVTREEVITTLSRIDYTLKPFDIVLIRTDADLLWGQAEYFTHFRGVSREATEWIVEQGVKVIGIDSFGFDPPFGRMLLQYQREHDPAVLWPAHVYGRQREYCQIERLANLHQIPRPYNFRICCFPIKVKDCGAGWSRVVALIEEEPSW